MKIYSVITLLLIAGFLRHEMLILYALAMALAALYFQSAHFCCALKRMRWLFVSILVVYAYLTPGELLPYLPVNYSPTYEGVVHGLMQIARLIVALAALSVLLASTQKEDLMAGLTMALHPLAIFGLDVRRFSVRLLLTLKYVETLALNQSVKFNFNHFGDVEQYIAANEAPEVIAFPERSLAFIDYMVLCVMSLILLVVISLEYV
ncbi:MAG: CbiQ family ECF transporter T component [Methylotenera sp.]|nr:CbiQ family ECF transporter T component [Methylotenera sp.]